MASRAYLDHASSSPLRPGVFEAMVPFLREHVGDPGRLHSEGRTVRVALEQAREQVASFVGARQREVVFCSSGTEAINAAHWWLPAGAHVVTTAVEHSAVRDSIDRRDDLRCTVVGVDASAFVSVDAVLNAVRDDTALVSVQLANHEVATIQPVAALCAALAGHGARVHIDACAAIGYVPISFAELGADFCSLTAHKFGGPVGAAALLVRRGVRVAPFIVGGAQERARRGGLENVAACVGFGVACEVADATLAEDARRYRALIDRAWRGIAGASDGVARFGPTAALGDSVEAAGAGAGAGAATGAGAGAGSTLPHLLAFGVEGVEAEPILLSLDQRGVAVHSGSACSSETWEPSPVLEAMGVDAQHSLRISVGWATTVAEIDHFIEAFTDAVARLRQLR